MKRLLFFGDYVFPDTQGAFDPRFSNVVQQTSRLPGLSGGFDEWGSDPAPSEVGSLSITYWLIAQNRSEITAMRDELFTLPGLGVKKLFMQPADQSELPRYCRARCINVQASENADKIDLHQQVTLNFQVAYPRWLRDEGQELIWGEGTWGEQTWGGNYPTFDLTSTPQDISITNDGNAEALVRFLYTPTVGGDDVFIERKVAGAAVEFVSLEQTLTTENIVNIDGRRLLVQVDGADAFDDFSYDHPNYILLQPGANTLSAYTTSGEGTLRVIWAHTWY